MFKIFKQDKVNKLTYCVVIKIDTGWNIERKFVVLKARNKEEAKGKALDKIGWSDRKKSWLSKEVEKVYCEI